MSNSGPESTVIEPLRQVLDEHPVRLAVLFGSEVTGRTHPRSDLDLVVEFDESVEDVRSNLLALHSDLMTGLQRNDVDLSLASDLKPRVGLAAFSEGLLVVGSEERMERHRERFERAVEEETERRESLRERFDAVIEGVDTALGMKS